MTYLNNLTQEEREDLKLKSKLTLERKKQEGAHLLQDFGTDKKEWKILSKKYGIRNAPYYIPATETKYIKRALRQLNIEISTFLDSVGCKSLKEYAEMNPDWPSYALVGVLLESYDGGDFDEQKQ